MGTGNTRKIRAFNWTGEKITVTLDGMSVKEVHPGAELDTSHAQQFRLARLARNHLIVTKPPAFVEANRLITCVDVMFGGGRFQYDDVGRVGAKIFWREEGEIGSTAQVILFFYDQLSESSITPGVIITLGETKPPEGETWPAGIWLPGRGAPRHYSTYLPQLSSAKWPVTSIVVTQGSTNTQAYRLLITVASGQELRLSDFIGTTLQWGTTTYGSWPMPWSSETVDGEPDAGYDWPAISATACQSALVPPQIQAGNNHTIGLQETQQLYGWGSNQLGQACLKTTETQKAPTRALSTPSGLIYISSRYDTTLGLASDGRVFASGSNMYGQCAVSNVTYPNVAGEFVECDLPAALPQPVQMISCGFTHSYFLADDGTVWWCGTDVNGEGGQGSTLIGVYGANPTLTLIAEDKLGAAFDDVVYVAAGNFHGHAIKSDGSLWGWGANSTGDLGIGTGWWSNRPVPVTTDINGDPFTNDNIKVQAAGAGSIVLKSSGQVWVTGTGPHTQIETTCHNYKPVYYAGSVQVTDAVDVAIGGGVVLAETFGVLLRNDGTVWAWGYNASGQLGNGSTTSSATPTQVMTGPNQYLRDIVAISAGTNHVIARRSDGVIFAWGKNLISGSDVGKCGVGKQWSNGVYTYPSTVVYATPLAKWFRMRESLPNAYSVFESDSLETLTSGSQVVGTRFAIWVKRNSSIMWPVAPQSGGQAHINRGWPLIAPLIPPRRRLHELMKGVRGDFV